MDSIKNILFFIESIILQPLNSFQLFLLIFFTAISSKFFDGTIILADISYGRKLAIYRRQYTIT